MARFLFVIVPVVARVWPAVAIGDSLAAAGHEVAWCGPEGDLRPLLGPDPTIFPTGKRSYRASRQMGEAAIRELWDEYLMPLNRFIQGPVQRAVDQYRPDVVLADQYAMVGALAAHRRGLRWATLASGVLELTPPADPALREWVASKVAAARELAGLPAAADVDPLFSPDLVIATTARALTGAAPLPGSCVLIGAALGRRRTDPGFDWDWLDPGRRHVLVTVGTLSAHLAGDFLDRVVAALRPMGGAVQAIINAAPDAVPDPPRHILVAPRLPMLALMPRLDAVVCQAGQSTVNEALVHGVPLVVAPIRLGEVATAEHVTRSGAGVMVSFASASPDELARAVTEVLEQPGYRERAGWLAGEFAAAGGAAAAAGRLIALAGAAALAGDRPRG